jgi:hypothetical protein
MKRLARLVMAAVLIAVIGVSGASADTLELKDGRVLQGRFLGGTQAILRFSVNGEVQTFNVTEIVALTFTNSYSSDAAPPADPAPIPASGADAAVSTDPGPGPAPAAAPVPAAAAAANLQSTPAPQTTVSSYGTVTVPAGQTLLVRMIDGVEEPRGGYFSREPGDRLERGEHAGGS